MNDALTVSPHEREFDPNWPHGHETMHGTPAEIVARGLRDKQAGLDALAVILHEQDEDAFWTYSADGIFNPANPSSGLNLRNRRPHTRAIRSAGVGQ